MSRSNTWPGRHGAESHAASGPGRARTSSRSSGPFGRRHAHFADEGPKSHSYARLGVPMSLHFDALANLFSSKVEDFRQAAETTDERVRQARAGIRDVLQGYQAVVEQVEDPSMRYTLHQLLGVPLERACVALGEPAP